MYKYFDDPTGPPEEEQNPQELVEETKPQVTEEIPIVTKYRVCVRNKLPIYEFPTLEAEVIGNLVHGTIVSSTGTKDDWVKINHKNGIGWITRQKLVGV